MNMRHFRGECSFQSLNHWYLWTFSCKVDWVKVWKKKSNPSYFRCPCAFSVLSLSDLLTSPSLSLSPLLSTPSLHPSSLRCCRRHLFGRSDEVCSLRKVCLLDWLIRCLVRVFEGKGSEQVSVVTVWVSSEEALVCDPTLLKAVMREVEGVRVPYDWYHMCDFSFICSFFSFPQPLS